MASVPDHAEPGHCPRCRKALVVGHWEGLKVYVNPKAVPFEDAQVLARYGFPVWRIVIDRQPPLVESEFGFTPDNSEGTVRGLRFYEYHATTPPSEGDLYVDHRCGMRTP